MATSNPLFNAFNVIDKSNSSVYRNRNGDIQLVAGDLPATVGQNWIPTLDATYDLGENTTPRRWRDLYLSRTALVDGTVSTTVLMVNNQAIFTNGPLYIGGSGLSNYNSNSPNIGTTGGGRWGNAYFKEVDASVKLTAGNTYLNSLTVTGLTMSQFGGIIAPTAAGTTDIGAAALPWKDIYITGNIYKNGVVYSTGGGSLGDLIPGADNIYDVGSVGNRWRNARFAGDIYCNNLYATNNIEALQGSLTVYNGSGNFGAGLTVGSSGVGNITVFGAVIVNNSNAVRPSANAQGSVGTTSQAWGYVAALTGYLDVLRPIATGTPVSSTSVGTSVSRYQSGYIDGLNSSNVVPYTDNTGSVGSAVLRYAAGYFNNLYLSSLPTSAFLASGSSTPATPITSGTPGFSITGTTSESILQWSRVGSIYTVSYKWKITVSSGWVAGTNYSRIDVLVDLPFTREVSGPTYGVASGGPENLPTFFGAISPPLAQDNKFYMTFRDVTLPALTISANVVTFQCIFQCNRVAA